MDGNICFVTSEGRLVFKNANQHRVQELIEGFTQAKQNQPGVQRFIVTFDDGWKIEAVDIWLAVGAQHRV